MEDSVGEYSGKIEYKIEVYPDDKGCIPHFHVVNKNNNFDTCIEIADNRYFRHGSHQSLMTNVRDRKLLQKFLTSHHKAEKYMLQGHSRMPFRAFCLWGGLTYTEI